MKQKDKFPRYGFDPTADYTPDPTSSLGPRYQLPDDHEREPMAILSTDYAADEARNKRHQRLAMVILFGIGMAACALLVLGIALIAGMG